MFERLTDRARAAVIQARATAAERGDQIRPVYLLHAVALGEGTAARALAGLGIDAGTIERQLDRAAPRGRPLEGDLDSADAEALASIGIDLDEIRRRVEESFGPGALGRGPAVPGPGSRAGRAGRMTMTGEAKQSLELAIKEARALHHTYLGDEHLLLGLLGAAELNPRGDFTLDTLRDLGIDSAQARQRVLDELRRTPDLT
jgi:ClpA/ClpB-like protein